MLQRIHNIISVIIYISIIFGSKLELIYLMKVTKIQYKIIIRINSKLYTRPKLIVIIMLATNICKMVGITWTNTPSKSVGILLSSLYNCTNSPVFFFWSYLKNQDQ